MKKIKIISTCAAFLLMIAIMAFGVYAASSVTLSVSGTISFTCTDVYVKVTYGIVGGETKGPYSSQAGDTLTWKDSSDKTLTTDELPALPNITFSESSTTLTYFITVENLHGMDIALSLGYNWANAYDNNVITATAVMVTEDNSGTKDDNISSTTKDGVVTGIQSAFQFVANTKRTLKVTLSLANTEYKAGGTFRMAMSAALNVNNVQAITFN